MATQHSPRRSSRLNQTTNAGAAMVTTASTVSIASSQPQLQHIASTVAGNLSVQAAAMNATANTVMQKERAQTSSKAGEAPTSDTQVASLMQRIAILEENLRRATADRVHVSTASDPVASSNIGVSSATTTLPPYLSGNAPPLLSANQPLQIMAPSNGNALLPLSENLPPQSNGIVPTYLSGNLPTQINGIASTYLSGNNLISHLGGVMLKARLEHDAVYGRCLATSEAVQRGDIVVEELPFAYGPKRDSGIVCLACYRFLQFGEDGDGDGDRCEICDWPLCGNCADAEHQGDHRGECEVFAMARVTFAGNVSEDGACPQLDCITPLRVLLAKESQPERWLNEVAPMEHHEQARRENADVWHADRVNIAQYLRGPCKLAERFSEELIMQVVGVLEVNAFEARTTHGYPIRCLYPYTGILAHNCVPNTARSIHPSEGYKIRLRAMVDLEEGQQLQHSYTYTLDGTTQRQTHLREGKFFDCTCERCLDASELQTHFSSLKCGQCTEGWLLPKQPTVVESSWNCRACDYSTSSAEVRQIVGALQAEVNAVQSLEMGAKRLEEAERLLRKYKSLLHPSHYIATGLRQLLIEMYGRVKGYEMVQLSDQLLERKAELCREVLRLLNVFEPGLSRTRAMNLYELHVPLVLLAKSGFISSRLNGGELRGRLVEAIDLLKECVEILQNEDHSSQEGILCGVAKQALQQLSVSVEGLGNDLD
ncbi:hypothetical protein ACLKA6_013817 [Drosophila palustris]